MFRALIDLPANDDLHPEEGGATAIVSATVDVVFHRATVHNSAASKGETLIAYSGEKGMHTKTLEIDDAALSVLDNAVSEDGSFQGRRVPLTQEGMEKIRAAWKNAAGYEGSKLGFIHAILPKPQIGA